MSELIIKKYFNDLSKKQLDQFLQLNFLYQNWNEKINLISRKDIEYLMERHILHSLSIAKTITFTDNTDILDLGTGGGFPGIPLAIMFPNSNFYLLDSIRKKINAVENIAQTLNLKNIKTLNMRVENLNQKFDFIVSRAVAELPVIASWVKNKIKKQQKNQLKNGILYLKGGDISNDIGYFKNNINVFPIGIFFSEQYFQTKNIVHLFNI
jgi:16S rRNA (guanine527-N7)-methyltransferase